MKGFVVAELSLELIHPTTMPVPDERCGLVEKGATGRDDPVKHVQIASAAGRRAHVERGVEQSDAFEHVPPECHVGSHSDCLDAD